MLQDERVQNVTASRILETKPKHYLWCESIKYWCFKPLHFCQIKPQLIGSEYIYSKEESPKDQFKKSIKSRLTVEQVSYFTESQTCEKCGLYHFFYTMRVGFWSSETTSPFFWFYCILGCGSYKNRSTSNIWFCDVHRLSQVRFLILLYCSDNILYTVVLQNYVCFLNTV